MIPSHKHCLRRLRENLYIAFQELQLEQEKLNGLFIGQLEDDLSHTTLQIEIDN